jgi:hypothetical protein
MNLAPEASVSGVSRDDHDGSDWRSSRQMAALVSEATGFAQPCSSIALVSSIISQSSVHARSDFFSPGMVNLLCVSARRCAAL